MKINQLNHVALPVANVEKSARFYAAVLGLEPIPRPEFDFPGAWFRIGTDQELHLIGRSVPLGAPPPGDRHFALCVDSMIDAENQLRQIGTEFNGPKRRPDGASQIFLRDPDGHMIELCELN